MTETKYGKYIVTGANLPPRPDAPPRGERTGEMLILSNDSVIKGAFYLNCALIWKPSGGGHDVDSHSHDWDEYIGFIGSNPEDPHDLGAEIEITLGDEKHTLTRSCAVFIPKGLQHCPIIFKRVDRPIFYFSTGPNPVYDKQ